MTGFDHLIEKSSISFPVAYSLYGHLNSNYATIFVLFYQ